MDIGTDQYVGHVPGYMPKPIPTSRVDVIAVDWQRPISSREESPSLVGEAWQRTPHGM